MPMIQVMVFPDRPPLFPCNRISNAVVSIRCLLGRDADRLEQREVLDVTTIHPACDPEQYAVHAVGGIESIEQSGGVLGLGQQLLRQRVGLDVSFVREPVFAGAGQ